MTVTLASLSSAVAAPGHAVDAAVGPGMEAAANAGPACYSRLVNEWFCTGYYLDRGDELWAATLEHLLITCLAVVVGAALALPLALLARSKPRLQSVVVGFSTGLYTVPSLALFPLLVPFTGLTRTTVVVGLALYSLTILVRSALDGLRSVPDEVVESARGLGYGPARLFAAVELPLALPVLFGGLRVATVSTVALTTVGTLVSYGGLGDLIKDGVDNNFRAELAAASVGCVLLAVVLDLAILALQRVATPWTRRPAEALG